MDILITDFVACCGYALAVWDGFGLPIGFRDAIDMDVTVLMRDWHKERLINVDIILI
jgi:hypothetical protein